MSKIATPDPGPTGPLKGVRIVDHTTILFGPYATQILADLGADVIKVEAVDSTAKAGGDAWRGIGPTPPGGEGFGPLFMMTNRNKRSVALDLRTPEGAAQMQALLASADVFVSNTRASALERLGLGYEQVSAEHPALIYAHASGYGAQGPYAGRAAYDDVIQAGSGLSHLVGRTDPEGRPRYVPSVMADKISGLFLAQAITAALYARERDGRGQFIEVPMLECMVSFNMVEHLFGHVSDPPIGPMGYPRLFNAGRRPLRTGDGYIAVLPYDLAAWRRFLQALEMDAALLEDPDYFGPGGPELERLCPRLEAALQSAGAEVWVERLLAIDLAVAKVNSLNDVLVDPHLDQVGLFETFEHHAFGAYRAIRHPVRYSQTPANIYRHPPALGEHTAELASELSAIGEDDA